MNQNQGYEYQNYDYEHQQQHYQAPIEHQNGHIQQPDLVAAAPPDTAPEVPVQDAALIHNATPMAAPIFHQVDRSEASPTRSIEPGSFGTGPDIIAASNHDEETIEQASEVVEQAYPGAGKIFLNWSNAQYLQSNVRI